MKKISPIQKADGSIEWVDDPNGKYTRFMNNQEVYEAHTSTGACDPVLKEVKPVVFVSGIDPIGEESVYKKIYMSPELYAKNAKLLATYYSIDAIFKESNMKTAKEILASFYDVDNEVDEYAIIQAMDKYVEKYPDRKIRTLEEFENQPEETALDLDEFLGMKPVEIDEDFYHHICCAYVPQNCTFEMPGKYYIDQAGEADNSVKSYLGKEVYTYSTVAHYPDGTFWYLGILPNLKRKGF